MVLSVSSRLRQGRDPLNRHFPIFIMRVSRLFIRGAGRRFGRSPKPRRQPRAAQAAVCPPRLRSASPPERGAAFRRVRGSGPLAGSRLLTPPCGSRGLRPRSPQRDIRRRLGRARVLLPAVAKPPLRGEFVRLSSQIASAPPGGVDFKLAAAR